MATKKNFTKVVCQNCGAEILIPAQESVAVGRVIGKNSGLGTVVLPTVSCGDHLTPGKALSKLMELADGNPAMMQLVGTIADQIEEGGYVDVQNIVRRWIPSQALAMQFSSCGFHRSLMLKGYNYSWKVLLEELRKQAKCYTMGDKEEYADRNRWYNVHTALAMAEHYLNELKNRVAKLPIHHHGKRKYVRLTCWLNEGKGVHISELPKLYGPLINAIEHIKKSAGKPVELYKAAFEFENARRDIKWKPEEPSLGFSNAYKAAGAYYTMKDLILFEGCQIKADKDGETKYSHYRESHRKFIGTEKSLALLEEKANEIANERYGAANGGYAMLGFLRDFLDYNSFDFEETKKKWNEQHELRMAAKKCSRRSRK